MIFILHTVPQPTHRWCARGDPCYSASPARPVPAWPCSLQAIDWIYCTHVYTCYILHDTDRVSVFMSYVYFATHVFLL